MRNLLLTLTMPLVLMSVRIECKCQKSYMTFCDDLDDLFNYEVENWAEVVVGSESADDSQLRPVNFDSIGLDRFDKLTTLIIIRQIKDLKTYTFGLDPDESKLEYLQLYGNDIKRIRESTFDALTLRTLNLENNSIEYIHKGAFYNCEIETIDLSNNKLEAIEMGVFTEEYLSNHTKEIILKNNKLESIDSGSFTSSLEILNLDNNNLKVLLSNVFENLQNLEELTLSHNKISTIPSLKTLKRLRVIDASHNQIIGLKIEDFNELADLEVLDLSYNHISYPLFFQRFNFPQRHPSLQISLAYNRLTHLIIGDNSFRDHIVFLYGNPWNCECWEILERFMVAHKVKRNKCDLMFFGNGRIPYCMHSPGHDCQGKNFLPNITKTELNDFSRLVEESQKTVKCKLKPKTL